MAQAEEEVIADPELSGGAAAAGGASADEEIIADPELGGGGARDKPASAPQQDFGWGDVYQPRQGEQAASGGSSLTLTVEEDEYDPMTNTGIAKMELLGQQSVDVHPEYNLEDFYETRLRFGGEVDFRISRRLRLSLGTRLDFFWAAPHQSDPYLTRLRTDGAGEAIPRTNSVGQVVPGSYLRNTDRALDQDRYELDIVPLSAYVDMTVAEGVHLRVGTQVISLGRMDGFSATDMLAVFDLRPQPKLDPAAAKLAQPAVRLDWDLNSWMTLQAVYVPWFMPHVSRPNRDQYTGTVLTGPGSQNLLSGDRALLEPGNQMKLTESALRYLGPQPDFSHPQAEARLNMRGGTFELAVLGGTAIEKIPSVYYVPALDQLMRTSDPVERNELFNSIGVGAASDRNAALFDVAYHRYYLVGFDGSFDLAPLQVGFEFAYSPARQLYAGRKDGGGLPLPNVSEQICNPAALGDPPPQADGTPSACAEALGGMVDGAWRNPNGNVLNRSIRKGVPVVQGTLHVEWIKGETFALAGELYYIQALELPMDRQRDWLGFIPGTGAFVGGLVGGNYLINEGQWRIDVTALAAPGPSFVFSPQVELRVVEGFYLNVGAQMFEGPAPKLDPMNNRAARNVTLGGLFNGYDNVYVGFRWLP